jgi:hypothetical protein
MGWFKKFFTSLMLGATFASSQPAQAQLNLPQISIDKPLAHELLPASERVLLTIKEIRGLKEYKQFKKTVALNKGISKKSLGYYLAPEGRNSGTFEQVCLEKIEELIGLVARCKSTTTSSYEAKQLADLFASLEKDIRILEKQSAEQQKNGVSWNILLSELLDVLVQYR